MLKPTFSKILCITILDWNPVYLLPMLPKHLQSLRIKSLKIQLYTHKLPDVGGKDAKLKRPNSGPNSGPNLYVGQSLKRGSKWVQRRSKSWCRTRFKKWCQKRSKTLGLKGSKNWCPKQRLKSLWRQSNLQKDKVLIKLTGKKICTQKNRSKTKKNLLLNFKNAKNL